MSEHLEGFGFDPSRRGNVFSGKPASAESFLQSIPPELLKQLVKLAEFGVFGEGGVKELMRSISKQGSLERNRLSKGLRRGKLGRRLGARSGAIENLIANRVLAPSFAGTEGAKRNLLVRNQESKLGGLSGIQDLLGFFQNQFALEEQTSGPGFLDFVGPAIDIGAIAFGGPAAGAVTNTARRIGGGLNNPRGLV